MKTNGQNRAEQMSMKKVCFYVHIFMNAILSSNGANLVCKKKQRFMQKHNLFLIFFSDSFITREF